MSKNREEKLRSGKESVVGIPEGLSFALARNVSAMRSFVEMSDEKRADVIDCAWQIESAKEMRRYVSSFTQKKTR